MAFASGALAQSMVATPAIPATSTAASSAGSGAAPQKTIFGCLGLTKANIKGCRDALCASQLGQMMNGMMMPLSGLTGGVIPTFCPPVLNAAALADQAALTGGPAGSAGVMAAAAAAQADVAGAGARIAAIEYLATLDCHYWPEAEAGLIGRLRGDRVECVRFAAARALGTGCCCTKKTVAALEIVVNGGDKDGFPSENSPRVRAAAFAALDRCVQRFPIDASDPVPPESPELSPATPPEPPTPGLSPFAPGEVRRPKATLGYYETSVTRRSMRAVIADARRSLLVARSGPLAIQTATTGDRSLLGALARASSRVPLAEQTPVRVAREVTNPSRLPVANRAAQRTQKTGADGVPAVDSSIARTEGANAENPRARNSLISVIRRSLRMPQSAVTEEPDPSQR
jgi:hypothetical protein